MAKPFLYLDMDELLTDFIGGACAAHDLTRQEFEAKRLPGQWDMASILGLTPTQFWTPINRAGFSFWANLKPLDTCKPLIQMAERFALAHDTDWAIITTPSMCPQAYAGKIAWAQEHLKRGYWKRVILSQDKLRDTHAHAILIDDRESTISRFNEHPTKRGILFPHVGNSLHHVEDKMDHIAMVIKLL